MAQSWRCRGQDFRSELSNKTSENLSKSGHLVTVYYMNKALTFCNTEIILYPLHLEKDKKHWTVCYTTSKSSLKPKVICHLFDVSVGAVLSYSCEIYGFGKCKEIEGIYLNFCKLLLKVKRFTCTMGVYGALGMYLLYVNRYVRTCIIKVLV